MSLSVRTRFEVFKRDRFTCSYCGRTPPEILLECDHIIPRAAGGSDDITNLTTACATCNRGKAARLLEEGTAPVVGRATVEELAERVEQAKAYMELLGGLQAVVDRQVGMVNEAWATAFGATTEETAEGRVMWRLDGGGEVWPNDHSIRRFLRRLTLEDVIEAVSIAAARMSGQAGTDATRYFYGVCNSSIREGRSPGEPKPATPQLTQEDLDREYQAGIALGRKLERGLIGEALLDPESNGFSDQAAVIDALWGDDA